MFYGHFSLRAERFSLNYRQIGMGENGSLSLFYLCR